MGRNSGGYAGRTATGFSSHITASRSTRTARSRWHLRGDARMRRRILVAALAFAIVAAPLATEAQPAKVARIGYLSPLSASADSTHSEAFRQGLRDLGYVEGRTVVIEARYADGRFARLPD